MGIVCQRSFSFLPPSPFIQKWYPNYLINNCYLFSGYYHYYHYNYYSSSSSSPLILWHKFLNFRIQLRKSKKTQKPIFGQLEVSFKKIKQGRRGGPVYNENIHLLNRQSSKKIIIVRLIPKISQQKGTYSSSSYAFILTGNNIQLKHYFVFYSFNSVLCS